MGLLAAVFVCVCASLRAIVCMWCVLLRACACERWTSTQLQLVLKPSSVLLQPIFSHGKSEKKNKQTAKQLNSFSTRII